MVQVNFAPRNQHKGAERTLLAFFVFVVLFTPGCGYHLAGKAVAIPENIDSIAIPVFVNRTTKYKLEQRLTSAVVDEFISRTRYRITSDPQSAKALLSGEVMDFRSTPVIFSGGAGSTYLITVRLKVSLKDLTTGKLLYENRNFAFREEFEISRDPTVFFPEEGPAVDRLAREFSKSLVGSVLEAF